MKRLTGNELRNLWFEFWKTKNHEIIPSSSLIPIDDPTLLWINAGVTPLKKYFDGSEKPQNPRMASSQKCIRTNDIENVGKTARHQTMFEMLGNFSIGDYFKKEAVFWAWEFLTDEKWLAFDKDKLYMTVYPSDSETIELWKSLGVEETHIIKLEDNFWEIGAGPSGPDTEIFYDRGEKYDPNGFGIRMLTEDMENDRYIEIWNNVFSMYNAKEGLKREEYPELPQKNIDTGMGLERMVSILQEVDTNFDTDLFMPIIRKIEEMSGRSYEGQMAFKVIADHIRAITFALSDGANFGNTGRQYILRRLLRRAVRYSKMLDITSPFLDKLVPVVVDIMKEHYGYLTEKQELVMKKVQTEETLFYQTLASGEKRLQELFQTVENKHIKGEDAFKLYDTYGFPFELTLEYASDAGYTVSEDEFKASMQAQKELARNSRNVTVSMNDQNPELLSFDLNSKFVGYDTLQVETKIIALFDGKHFTDVLEQDGYVVLEQTPFYVEAGGQVSDQGTLVIGSSVLDIEDAFKGPNGQFFYFVKTTEKVTVGDIVEAKVEESFRDKVNKNHSAVHLLQKALRDVLGTSVAQAGSKVDDQILRFDFTSDVLIGKENLIQVEAEVNKKIGLASPTVIDVMPLEEAKKRGAMALFGDKYGDVVRVVSIADSMELCGGTHVKHSGEIEEFAIASFESKGSGVFRITAATGANINKLLFETIKPYNDEMIKLLGKARNILMEARKLNIDLYFDVQINNEQPRSYVDVMFNLTEVTNLKQKVSNLDIAFTEAKKQKALEMTEEFTLQIKDNGTFKYLMISVENYDMTILKGIVDSLIQKEENLFIFAANTKEGAVSYLAKATSTLQGKLDCGQLVKDAASKSNGNGGGNTLFAQGGGTDISSLPEILEQVLETVR